MTNPQEKGKQECCEKCMCKCKGAVTAHYGCDNKICSCHLTSTPKQEEIREQWPNKLGDLVKKHSTELTKNGWVWLSDFISSLLTSERTKVLKDVKNLKTRYPSGEHKHIEVYRDEALEIIGKYKTR